MVEETITDNLKHKIISWEEILRIRKEEYNSAKAYNKKAEEDLRKAKRVKNGAYKNLREARLNLSRAKKRLSAYPSIIRSWAKRNMDKVLLFEKKRGEDG